MDYDLDHDDVKAAFEAVCAEERVSAESELVWDAVIEEADLFNHDEQEVVKAFEGAILGEEPDTGSASWAAQRMRGQIARRLGYLAVEMNDEHGISYLVLPGVEFKKVSSDS